MKNTPYWFVENDWKKFFYGEDKIEKINRN